MLPLLTVLLLSFMTMLLLCKQFIYLGNTYFRAVTREDTPEAHRVKDYTPTMGGLVMAVSLLIVMAVALPWTLEVGLCVLLISSFCAIGAWDDWTKIRFKKGISERAKFSAQVVAAGLVSALWCWFSHGSPYVFIPIIGALDVPWWALLLWAMWVILCTVNAVNFTDGLDGLATLTLLPNFALYTYLALMVGAFDVALVGMAFIGALLAFLWYNSYPASVFMGDSGSLVLGASLAFMALMLKAECLIPLTGIIFVVEGMSVVLQIFYFKATGGRLFKLAPIHHHFEMIGYKETQITMRFFIVTIIACVATWVLFVVN